MNGDALLNRRTAMQVALGGALSAVPVERALAKGGGLEWRSEFGAIGCQLNAAALHPTPRRAVDAAQGMLASILDRNTVRRPPAPARAAIATLINAREDEIALVPSTGQAENMVARAMQLGPGAGVVTDALHFEGSLAMYGERARGGMPLTVVRPREGSIHLDDIAAAITPATKLIALAEISNFNGFRHDLRAVCDLAHAHGVLVFADVIQAVGAVPLDVRASGVDFCAASTYKWLMGDLGFGFLYVKRDIQPRLRRATVGWAELPDTWIAGQQGPYDPAVLHDRWTYSDDAAGLFEVGQPSWISAAMVTASIGLIRDITPSRAAAHRDSIRAYARSQLSRIPGVVPITPEGQETTIETFAIMNADKRFAKPLAAQSISVELYDNRMRIAPSLYNRLEDIDTLVAAMRRAI